MKNLSLSITLNGKMTFFGKTDRGRFCTRLPLSLQKVWRPLPLRPFWPKACKKDVKIDIGADYSFHSSKNDWKLQPWKSKVFWNKVLIGLFVSAVLWTVIFSLHLSAWWKNNFLLHFPFQTNKTTFHVDGSPSLRLLSQMEPLSDSLQREKKEVTRCGTKRIDRSLQKGFLWFCCLRGIIFWTKMPNLTPAFPWFYKQLQGSARSVIDTQCIVRATLNTTLYCRSYYLRLSGRNFMKVYCWWQKICIEILDKIDMSR